MVRSVQDTCTCVTAELSEIETSELQLNAWKGSLVTVNPSVRECSSSSGTKPRPKGPRTFGSRPDARKRNSPLHSFRVWKLGPSLFRLVLKKRP